MSQPKVYEFAKLVGVETLVLMEKFRAWKLPIKSHMSPLSPELVDKIQMKLEEEKGGRKKAKKKIQKKASKKQKGVGEKAPIQKSSSKTTVKKETTKKTTTKKGAIKKTTTQKAVAKKASTTKASTSKTKAQKTSSKTGSAKKTSAKKRSTKKTTTQKAGVKKVSTTKAPIKKLSTKKSPAKKDSGPSSKVAKENPTPQIQIQKEPLKPSPSKKGGQGAEGGGETQDQVSVGEKKTSSLGLRRVVASTGEGARKGIIRRRKAPISASSTGSMDGSLVEESPPRSLEVEKGGESTPSHRVSNVEISQKEVHKNLQKVGDPETSQGLDTTAKPSFPKEAPTPSVARKREVKMTEAGLVSGVKSDRLRRNIVGKVDLSQIEGTSSKGPHKTTHRNLRTGFVAAKNVSLDPLPDESDRFQSRRDKDKKRRQEGNSPASPSAKDREPSTPPSFVSSDFKKREVVFQPKKKKVAIDMGNFKKTQITTPAAHKRLVRVYGSMGVSELAGEIGVKSTTLIQSLLKSGVTAHLNMDLDFETISLIVPEFGYEAVNEKKTDQELMSSASFGDMAAEKVPRPPVITVMGHVDHGKTTLLDFIRKSQVAKGEAGGITQHMGAYGVQTKVGSCTFIDTPGHEAFTAMRSRGAQSTDIVILVVAADDGLMPQTVEAINHAKAAQVPIIVALNKMDLSGVQPDQIKKHLSEHELIPEEWGGTTIFCPISALKGDGIDDLLEQVSLQAEILELKANPQRSAVGVVLESRVEKGRGSVATLLVQDGTLKKGQHIVMGEVSCRIRNLFNEFGQKVDQAGPSHSVQVTGLPESPLAGDHFGVTRDEKSAQLIVAQRRQMRLDQEASKSSTPTSLQELFSQGDRGDRKELAVVLKTDVSGSMEAIEYLFKEISVEEVGVKVIHSAVGGISESDVLLASASKGLIVGFNTRPDSGARSSASQKGVEIKTYSIVYDLVEDMKRIMAGLLDPDVVEKSLGRLEVRETFTVPKVGTIAGGSVLEGKMARNSLLRLIREGKIVYTGKLSSLRRFKDDVKEVQTGYECGVGIENFNDIKVGDEIEAFVEEKVVRKTL